MKRIHFYLGAHKTATTHLQGILIANRDELVGRGIHLTAPHDVRKTWLPAFFRYCNGRAAGADAALAETLRGLAPADGLWILTEENIVGVSHDLCIKPGIYPAAAERLACLLELFGDFEPRFFFSLRSYGTFYRSAYSEVVRNRGYMPFSGFYDAQRFAGNSWVAFVDSIQKVIPQQNMVLWRFEDFGDLVPQLVSELTGLEDPAPLMANYKTESTRPSLSGRTMEILESLAPVLNRKESLQLVERINRAYAIEDGFEPYRPFPPETEAAFRRQYDKDVAEIRARFPAIRFLDPRPAAAS